MLFTKQQKQKLQVCNGYFKTEKIDRKITQSLHTRLANFLLFEYSDLDYKKNQLSQSTYIDELLLKLKRNKQLKD